MPGLLGELHPGDRLWFVTSGKNGSAKIKAVGSPCGPTKASTNNTAKNRQNVKASSKGFGK
jgi:hypothetical protein